MRARDGHWFDVRALGYIQDLHGKTWKVVALNDKTVDLVDRNDYAVTIDRPRNGKPVVLVEPTIEDATKTLQEILGAVAIREEVPKR